MEKEEPQERKQWRKRMIGVGDGEDDMACDKDATRNATSVTDTCLPHHLTPVMPCHKERENRFFF